MALRNPGRRAFFYHHCQMNSGRFFRSASTQVNRPVRTLSAPVRHRFSFVALEGVVVV
jgi:hypothetical protein